MFLSPRLTAALCLMLTCGLFFFVFVMEDLPAPDDAARDNVPWGLIARYTLAMAAGGAVVGLGLWRMFGRAGSGGVLLSLLGGVIASLVAGLLGSAFGLMPDLLSNGFQVKDLIPIGFGLLVVPLAIVEVPFLAVIWLAAILATHAAVRARRGRDG